MFFSVRSMGIFGMDAYAVNVETDISKGVPQFEIIGLPDASVKEARDRVRTAIRNSGLRFPLSRIIINLAPADVRKVGTMYDLPILIAVLSASGLFQLEDDCAFLGEISLGGEVRPVRGVLPMVLEAKKLGVKKFFVPADNSAEAAVVEGMEIYPVTTVTALIDHLCGTKKLPVCNIVGSDKIPTDLMLDFSEVKGQYMAKRALEIAASGGHNVLLIGSPGAGKSMLAKRVPTILPDMTFDEMIETTKIHSVSGELKGGISLIRNRPFRSPHHTVSPAGLSGGGSIPMPGEISLAHNGVLFLDELPEFSRPAMEILRQPIEDGMVTISRANASISYPCSITLIAAMNPCPCGYFGHPTKECTCTQQAVAKYLAKVSGPLLDRLDLHIEVPPVEFEELSSDADEESSAEIKKRVDRVRKIQTERFRGTSVTCNARMTPAMQKKFCRMDDSAREAVRNAFDTLGLSARAYDRVLKVSRTVADMDGSEVIKREHVFEAIQYRSLDRKYWKN